MKHLIIALALCVMNVSAELVLISGDGASKNRVRIIMIGDGYTAAQQSSFIGYASTLFNSMKNETYYAKFQGAINVYAAFSASPQSGADHPLQGSYVSTAFDGTFGSNTSLERLVTVNASKVTSFLLTQLANYDPNYDITLVVVNDAQYGGSGGSIAITTMNSSGIAVSLHEIGHSFGKLADEYDYQPEYSPGEYPNSTAQTSRASIKWNVWIDASTPIPTPETSVYDTKCGLFEGACYRTTGWYRPWNKCMMSDLNHFCPVCNEELITVSYKQISPIDGTAPAAGTIINASSQPTISITLLPVSQKPLVTWVVNGTALATQGESLNLSSAGLLNGTNSVKAIVKDNTGLVKIPAHFRYSSDTVSWTVQSSSPSAFVYASDLAWSQGSNGWGPVEKDKSNGESAAGDGKTITLAGVTYTKGFGCHAISDITVPLNKSYSTFTSNIGVDDEINGYGSVVFSVVVDGVTKYTSATLTGSSATQSVSVDVTNGTTLTLRVRDGGDGNSGDHADWASAKLTTFAQVPTFTLTTIATNGTVTLNPAGGTYNSGTVVTVTATPNSGYKFSSWNGNLSGTINPTTITMNANKSVTANFTVAPVTDIAQGKATTASSNEASSSDYSGTPASVVDGNSSTRWSSLWSDQQWITVDLGSVCSINRIYLNWETASAKNYVIQTSNDHLTWTTVLTKTNMPTGPRIDDLTGLSAAGRYVNIYGTARNTTYGYSLFDFKVYGSSSFGNPVNSPTVLETSPIAQNNSVFGIKYRKKGITISVAEGNPGAGYTVMDIAGRVVLRGTTVANQEFVDMSSITKGMYIINVLSGSKRIIQKIMVK
jgi:hypothetical protein